MSDAFDVLVVGGGPAGAALAGAVARQGRRVALFERSAFAEPRAGESLGPEVRPLLVELGAWDALGDVLGREVPFRGVRSAWGSDRLEERSSMFHPLGAGWHVDRARFDGALARWAASSGAELYAGAGPCVAARDGAGFVVRRGRAGVARGGFFVDASGQGAPAGRLLGARRWLACDRQVALVRRVTGPDGAGTDLLLEAVEEGWWYSAPQPGGALVVALVTDADLVPAGAHEELEDRFGRALERTTHTAERSRGGVAAGPVRVVRAGTGCLLPRAGPGWCAIGDAALSVDPLSGGGVVRALRSALEASASLGASFPAAALERDLERRASYHEIEARWPDAPFWLRRRPGRWREAAITLDPRTRLEPSLPAAGRQARAAAEALVPPVGIAAALGRPAAEPAHRLLERMRAAAPLGDRRLLAGLQLLLERGCLRALGREPGPANEGHMGREHVVVGHAGGDGDDLGGSHR